MSDHLFEDPNTLFEDHFDEILITADQIQHRIHDLADQISGDYRDIVTLEEPLVLVCVLKGAFLFCSDLLRQMRIPTEVDFMKFVSYGDSTTASGPVQLLSDLKQEVRGKHVLIVEDVIDTSSTLQYLKFVLGPRQPASLRTCVLLDKMRRDDDSSSPDYCGFQLRTDEFLVGYGMDYSERYRQLPYVAALRPERYEPITRRSSRGARKSEVGAALLNPPPSCDDHELSGTLPVSTPARKNFNDPDQDDDALDEGDLFG